MIRIGDTGVTNSPRPERVDTATSPAVREQFERLLEREAERAPEAWAEALEFEQVETVDSDTPSAMNNVANGPVAAIARDPQGGRQGSQPGEDQSEHDRAAAGGGDPVGASQPRPDQARPTPLPPAARPAPETASPVAVMLDRIHLPSMANGTTSTLLLADPQQWLATQATITRNADGLLSLNVNTGGQQHGFDEDHRETLRRRLEARGHRIGEIRMNFTAGREE